MFKNLIRDAVREEMRGQFQKEIASPPDGYNPLEVIRGGLFHWIAVPFNDAVVWCKLRTPRLTELESAGATSLIEQETDEVASLDDYIKLRNIQEAHAKCVLVEPSFDEIYKLVTGEDAWFNQRKKELEEIKAIPLDGLSAIQKDEIQKRIFKAELAIAFVLPDDTMTFLSNWALGVDVTEIRKVNDEKFLEAALMSRRYGGKATDYIKGAFTERDEGDMNKYAMVVEQRFNEQKKVEQEVGKLPGKRK